MRSDSQKNCKVETCERKARARGWCDAHYARWMTHGDVQADVPIQAHHTYVTPETRFDKKTKRDGECLLWTGALPEHGRGKILVRGKPVVVQRFAWERVNGPIPAGGTINITCGNRACVEPAHLRLASKTDNTWSRRRPASGVKSVYAKGRGWGVQIWKDGHKHYRGTYATVEEAAAVAETERKRLFG